MKRLLINTALLILLAGTFSSCKKKLEDDYLNPELTTTGSLSKLFSGMFMNKRIHPSYWDYYTFVMPTTAAFSQSTALSPSAQMYTPNTSYTQGRWTDFYNGTVDANQDFNYSGPGILNSYREMQTSLGSLSAAQQQEQMVFLKCAQVLVYDQTAQMIDLWGDIPFSQANSLNTDRTVKPAPFDDAAALYDTLISGLKDLNTYFDTVNVVSSVNSELTKADLMYAGNLAYWQRYANSLRLRLLMRISNVSESKAQTEVTTMLGNATTYPLIDDNTQNALFKMSPTAVKSDLRDVFITFGNAPEYMLDLMVTNNDPRTEVYWDANDTTGFRGVPYNVTGIEFEAGGYATYDSATFYYNYALPAVIFTASEVSFLKAEAAERWGVGTAQTAYETAITQSVAFWYGINQSRVLRDGTPTQWPVLATPSAATVTAFLQESAIAYAGTTTEKLAKIYTQKWLHFSVVQAGQAWAELRRTDYPVLQFATSTNGNAANPPVRLLYPATETVYNSANYSAVSAKDTRDTKIFWDVK
jgi:hypothetical protein